MTGLQLKEKFELKSGNRNIQDSDFLIMLNEGLRYLCMLGRNFDTFRRRFLLKEKEVSLYEEDETGRHYIKMSELDTNVMGIEGEQGRDGDKVYIDVGLIKTDGDTIKVQYDRYLDDITNLNQNVGLGIYEEPLLDAILATYYEMRTDSIELANYYKTKILHFLSL